MIRTATVVWRGVGSAAHGDLSTELGVLSQAPYSFKTRFENAKGANPEELIAAAGAGRPGSPHYPLGVNFARQSADPRPIHVRKTSSRHGTELPGVEGSENRDHVGREAGLGCLLASVVIRNHYSGGQYESALPFQGVAQTRPHSPLPQMAQTIACDLTQP
jgi:hypothetical protein